MRITQDLNTFSAKQWNYRLEYKLLGDTVSRIQEYGKKGSGETNKWKVQWLYKQCAWEV